MTPKKLHEEMIIMFKGLSFLKMNTDFITHEMINIPGFFPYFNGSFDKKDSLSYTIPKNCTLVVGQDWGTMTLFKKLKKSKNIINDGITYKNLGDLIKTHGGNTNNLFLSNLLIGLRNKGSIEGRNPELEINERYKEKCIEFLEKQVELIQPKSIICLGKVPHEVIHPVGEKIKTFKEYYNSYSEEENKLIIGNYKSNYITIPHPCRKNNLQLIKNEILVRFLKNSN